MSPTRRMLLRSLAATAAGAVLPAPIATAAPIERDKRRITGVSVLTLEESILGGFVNCKNVKLELRQSSLDGQWKLWVYPLVSGKRTATEEAVAVFVVPAGEALKLITAVDVDTAFTEPMEIAA